MPRARRGLRSAAAPAASQTVRCAIYTRKSTDEGLDSDFNSLDAQREIAESYVSSQRADGWNAVADRYDDGGYTGANMNRPALRRLLADVEAGAVDLIVVYRYDRLSRSLLDFLQLLEFLKKHDVGFVSVSERFDTSTPHGEMALNMVLSVAQCERKVIGQRTSDKLCAARRRGKWTGGMPPLGYDVAPEGGRLVVNATEAEQVRAVFELYVEHGALTATVAELNRRGWRRKSWATREGKQRQGAAWTTKTLHQLLVDPRCIGKQTLGAETFQGEHSAIVPKSLFEKAQAILAGNRGNGGATQRNKHGALLRGLLHCAACNASMTYALARNRHQKAYRYYRCTASAQPGTARCPTGSVRATPLEDFVVDQIRRIGQYPELQRETFEQAVAQAKAQVRGLKAEARRLEQDLVKAKRQVSSLVAALTDATGAGRTAVYAELEKEQQRVHAIEHRVGEIRTEQTVLESQAIDEADVAAALQAFDPLWEVLLTPEKERVLRQLIERVEYDGAAIELTIHWRIGGFGELAAEIEP